MAKASTQTLINFPVRKSSRIQQTPIEQESHGKGTTVVTAIKTPSKSDGSDVSPPKIRRHLNHDRSLERGLGSKTPVDVKLKLLKLRTPRSENLKPTSLSSTGRKPRAAKSLFHSGTHESACHHLTPSSKSETRKELNAYERAKLALNSSFSTELKHRDVEYNQVKKFVQKCISGQESGSLYVSGAPGTGKTFCVTQVIQELKEKYTFEPILVNCMGCRTPNNVYSKILSEAGLATPKKATDSVAVVTDKIVTPRKGKKVPMTVLVLDEIDELENKNQDVLYTVFDWPRLEGSRVVVIGICNTLDFTTRSLKRCHSLKLNSVESINFQPYSMEQVKGILSSRLPLLENGYPLVSENALNLCARKVSSFSGDIRKALHVIRRSIELAELDGQTSSLPLKPKCDDGGNSPVKNIPIKKNQPNSVVQVGVQHVMKVLNEVYASKALEMTRGTQSMPTQQQVALCVLLLFHKFSNLKEMLLSKFHDSFIKISCKKTLGFTVESRSEFLGMCQLLESKGFVSLKSGKETSLTRISLNVDEQEIDQVMTDKTLLKGILSDPSFVR